MARDTFHVVPANEGWAVKREGNERPSSTHDTQKNAIDAARELAKEGDEIVVHRADGSIREHTTYMGASSNGNGNARSDRPEAHDIWSVGTRVRWSPILAGIVTALAINLLLTAFAAAIGLTTMQNMRASTVGTIAGITWMVIMITSLFAGGYVATQLTTRETKFEAVLLGLLVWGGTLAISALGAYLGSNLALDATRTASNVTQQRPFWEEMNWSEERMRERMGQLSDEEQQRFNDYRDRAKSTLREANPRAAAWWMFGGMALSVAAAIAGAVLGAGPEVTRRILHGDTTAGREVATVNRESITV